MSEQKNIGIDRPSFLQRLVKQKMALVGGIVIPVSYTHLDVYKRQPWASRCSSRRVYIL